MIRYLMSTYLMMTPEHDEYRHNSLILISIISSTGVAAFFMAYNMFYFYPPILITDGLGTLAGLGSLYLFLKKRAIKASSLILLLMTTGVCLSVILDSGNAEYCLAWAFITPILSIFLMGLRFGSLFSLVYMIFLTWYTSAHLGIFKPAPWTISSVSNVIAVYSFIFFLSCYYEASRRAAHDLLKKSNDKLAALAFTDPLTGLYNRRYIEDYLLDAQTDKFVVMADVDDFKRINDRYGHLTGDEVLIGISSSLKKTVGSQGQVGRWGGEEFFIVFHSMTRQNMLLLLEEILRNLRKHDFGVDSPVTISLGVVTYRHEQHKSSLRKADEALYAAKVAGKNCFRFRE